jgi:GT2 family glycosyltransferase
MIQLKKGQRDLEREYKMIFLILNNETYWETNNCIKSIYKTIGDDRISSGMHEIVIVDNGSKNESLSKLKANYDDVDGIHVLSTGENLGFAKGNNYGFQYAKEKLKPDFIVMINSDVIMTDIGFEEKLAADYEKYKFGVAGPMVSLENGNILNPSHSRLITAEAVRKRINLLRREVLLCKLKIQPIFAAGRRMKKKLHKPKNLWDGKEELDLKAGFLLHGCFLIFSKEYIDRFDGIYDKTFLYGEELLLRLRCMRADMKMYVLPDIEGLHKESRTEKFIGGNINERHLRRYKNMLDAIRTVYDYMVSEDI